MKGKGDIYVFAICKRCSYRRTGQKESRQNAFETRLKEQYAFTEIITRKLPHLCV